MLVRGPWLLFVDRLRSRSLWRRAKWKASIWSARASRQAVPAGGSCLRGRRCAPTALRCSPHSRVAELASFASLTALKQLRRISSRCALRAPTVGLRFSSLHKSPPAGTACRDDSSLAWRRTNAPAKACSDRPRRACGAPSSTGLAAARASALRRLTRRHCLIAANEVSEASSAAGCKTEQASPDAGDPVNRLRLTSGLLARAGAACKAREVGAQRRPRR